MGNSNTSPWDENNSLVKIQHTASITAGFNMTISPLGHSTSKLVSLAFLLTTDANVADRHVHIILTRSATNYLLSSTAVYQAASLARQYHFMISGALNFLATPYVFHAPLPDAFIFLENDTLGTVIDNLQATDQITNVDIIWKTQPVKP